ncbi:MAG: DUF1523 family protein [Micrococcaceae bacterium]
MFGKKHEELEQESHESVVASAGRKTKKVFKRIIWTVVLLAILAIAAVAWYYYGTAKTEKCNVTRVEQQGFTNASTYRVYTQPSTGSTDKCGVMGVHDTMAYMNFNSADLFGQIQEGHNYEIKNYGFRNGFFGWFPNIVSVNEIGGATTTAATPAATPATS